MVDMVREVGALGREAGQVVRGIEFRPGMALRLVARSLTAGLTIRLVGYVELLDGRLSYLETEVPTAAVGVDASVTVSAPVGRLLYAVVRQIVGAVVVGETWARLDLIDQGRSGNPIIAVIGWGFVTALSGVSWPALPLGSYSGQELGVTAITVANPAPGVSWTYTLSGEEWTELLGCTFLFTADGNAGSRIINLIADDGATTLVERVSPTVTTLGLNNTYSFSDFGSASVTVGNDVMEPYPRLALGQGHRLRVATSAIQVGDQYSNIRILVRRRPRIL